jgi:hypothetical protein
MQDLRIPGVGCLAAEDQLRVERASDLLVHTRVVEESLPGTAGFRRDVRRPEARFPRASLQGGNQLERGVVLAFDRGLVRVEVFPHERPVASARLDVLGRKQHRQ